MFLSIRRKITKYLKYNIWGYKAFGGRELITKTNFRDLVISLGFISDSSNPDILLKQFPSLGCELKVDFENEILIYPEENGFVVNDRTTCNFGNSENFVVFECVHRLLNKGYRPEHIELEKRWNLGRNSKGGKADICVYDTNGSDMLCIIECKTFGREYTKELVKIESDGGQLFSYWQQERSTKWLILYTSDFNKNLSYITEGINCSDDANIVELSKKDNSIFIYKNAHSVSDLFYVWKETYEKAFHGDVIFDEDTQAYNVGIKPLRKKDLVDFNESEKVVNSFEEILRHNNVSDKENAFNRLLALFICKLVDEINKIEEDVVEFQYKIGTDTYESLQDRLQKLHQQGMDEFMNEKIFYVPDDYAENLVQQYTGQKRSKMIKELRNTLRVLKFYTNNDFAFKEVHNEELFYHNGKILVEVVQLFQKYRIVDSKKLQLLGDLFEQLLSKGFKQNEGQFFTPIPITKFIWMGLPLQNVMEDGEKRRYPMVIDYACGAGHFLTEGVATIRKHLEEAGYAPEDDSWIKKSIYGMEKDYRLARVSKISLFMHGAGKGNIIFGDGLENYPEKEIKPNTFDILVANPPYSVSGFKPHLGLKNNSFSLLPMISNDGSEIETLFVERIEQLLKPKGLVAIILPEGILRRDTTSFVGARCSLISNFKIHAIVHLGNKTFGATGQPTIVMFMEKFNEPPKRNEIVDDSVEAIFNSSDLSNWEDEIIFNEYLLKIDVSFAEYQKLIQKSVNYNYWADKEYFSEYVSFFLSTTKVSKKLSSKSYLRLTSDEKMKWLNQHFYIFVHSIEQEKLKYFSLVYDQTTLIISSPTDIKGQEKFLGYKWSNRKGMEGIQILNEGGQLYDSTNLKEETTLASLVKDSFFGIQRTVPELSEYYYYNNLKDMIDFDSVIFNKVIRTAKTRDRILKPGYTKYKLSSNLFDISIGRRVVESELDGTGSIPVYSANVRSVFGKINKHLLTDFSTDSILWGIDGDWMVNIIKAGQVFYPTDHCGVIRIKTDKILPEYLALALEVEGNFEKFSRSNRASTERIRNLTLYIPDDIDEQRRILEKINNEKKGANKDRLIQQYFME